MIIIYLNPWGRVLTTPICARVQAVVMGWVQSTSWLGVCAQSLQNVGEEAFLPKVLALMRSFISLPCCQSSLFQRLQTESL